MTAHTAGPWRRVDRRCASKDVYIEGANGAEVIVGYDYEGLHMDDADIDRAVACVNACEGMDDPAEEILRLREEITQRVSISTVDGLTDKERELAELLRAAAPYCPAHMQLALAKLDGGK